jgi:hypothetical protein
MTNTGYQHFADALVFAHGPSALREAIRHAELCLKQGDTDMAAHWQATIKEVRQMKSTIPGSLQDRCLAA